MVLTITPMVHGGKRVKWLSTVLVHALGGVVGGAMAALVVVLATRILIVLHLPVVPVAFLILGLSIGTDAKILPLRVPSPRRQVPSAWRERFGPHFTAFLYGLGLGTGFTTRVYFAATYAAFLVAALIVPFPLAVAVGAAYGFSRGIAVWIAQSGSSLERLERAIHQRAHYLPIARAANVASLGAVIVSLALTTS